MFPTDPALLTRDEHVRQSLEAMRRRRRLETRAAWVRRMIAAFKASERPPYFGDAPDRTSTGVYQMPPGGSYHSPATMAEARDVYESARRYLASPAAKSLQAVREDHEAGR